MPVKLTFEGIRCFVTKQEAVLRPLTLLVGENSSGKSTFLALCRIACEFSAPKTSISFNVPPFLLGAYDQIASSRNGRGGQAKSFSIGVEVDSDAEGRSSVEAVFVPRDGQPVPSWKFTAGRAVMSAALDRSGDFKKPAWMARYFHNEAWTSIGRELGGPFVF